MRAALLLALLAAAAPASLLGAPAALALIDPPIVPDVAAGFTVMPLVPTFPAIIPAGMNWGPGDADGPDLYVAATSGTVYRFPLLWSPLQVPVAGGPPAAFAAGLGSPLGVVFQGSTMFVADSHAGAESGRTDGRVWREDGANRVAIVDGLPNGRHNTNHLRFGPDGRLYIANGNPNDNGQAGGDADVFPYSGAILSVDVAQVSASPAVLHWRDNAGNPIPPSLVASDPRNADFASKVQVLGHGFRNVFGIAFSPAGVGYTGMNGADDPSSQDPLYKIAPGTDYGFPFCYNTGTPGAVGADVHVTNNPLFPNADCTVHPPAAALLGWHVCATGIDFPPATGMWAFPPLFRDSVYVGECGFFFPEPDRMIEGNPLLNTGHKVARVSLDANGDAVEVNDFLHGVLPTDVRFGPDGAMYVLDVEAVLRVAPAVPNLG